MKKLIITAVIFILSISLFASFNDYEPSVRARGIGGAYTTLSDESDGIFYNPAGFNLSGNTINLSSAHLYGESFITLYVASFSANLPKKLGTIGLGLKSLDVTYLDVNLTSEKQYSLGHSICIMNDIHSRLYFGYSLNFYNLAIDTFGSDNTFGLNVGALAILHQRTRLGFSISNINNPKIGKDNDEDLPQKFAVGISYIPYEGTVTAIDIKKGFGEPTEIHAGAEVKLHKMFYLRAGIRNEPVSFSMGFRFTLYNVNIDYAFNSHSELGGTHHFGIGYKF
jgi:hypothetical protein